jgi:hypothetical protein
MEESKGEPGINPSAGGISGVAQSYYSNNN